MSPAHYALAEALRIDPATLTGPSPHPITTLTEEEALYWHAKCRGAGRPHAKKALYLLLRVRAVS